MKIPKKKQIEQMIKDAGDIFFDSIGRDLNKKDAEDGATVTREQKILRAIMILHYRLNRLEKLKKR